MNLGPDSVYIRDVNPNGFTDPQAETLPANCADNAIFVDEGTRGLRIRAGSGGATVSIRVSQSIGVW